MSDLARRRRSVYLGRTVMAYCDECDRVLYALADSLFCPVCSSSVVPTEDTASEVAEVSTAS
ncbi:MAG TPA: hypothetical protein VJ927_03415 [Actinomycetota bacterium]|nr:hypothetical protein [Actinomycetota bacterium]